MTQQFTLDESRLANLAACYPVETDHDAMMAVDAAIHPSEGEPLITGPCEMAVDSLANGDGEIDAWRVIICPGRDAPWLGSPSAASVEYLDRLPEPDEEGGLYDPAVIIRNAVADANWLLDWHEQVTGTTDEDTDEDADETAGPAWNVLARVTARQAATNGLEAVAAVAASVVHRGFDLYDLPSARTAYEDGCGAWHVTVPVVAVLAAPRGGRALARLRIALAGAGFETMPPQPRDAFRSEDGAVVTDFLPGELRP
jgi:hypothetical protein